MYRRQSLLLIALLTGLLVACNTASPGVTSVAIVGGDRALEPGDQTLLSALVVASAGIDTAVTWSVDDSSVATVSGDGTLVAQTVGDATVTATSVADATKSDSIAVSIALDPASPQKVDATLIPPTGAEPIIGVALYFQEGLTIAAASFTEVMEGLYFGPVGAVSQDGSTELILPDTTDVPEGLMATAATFLPIVAEFTGCSLTASDAAVRVTYGSSLFESMNGVAVLTITGADPAIAVDAPLDPDTYDEEDLLSVGHLAWVYAEEPVTVQATGAGCTADTTDLIVDVSLEAGWNQLTWEYVLGETDLESITLRNSDGEPVYIVPAPFI